MNLSGSWVYSQKQFTAFRTEVSLPGGEIGRAFLPVEKVQPIISYKVIDGTYKGGKLIHEGTDRWKAEAAKAKYLARPNVPEDLENRAVLSDARAAHIEIASELLPVGQFRLITTKAKGTKMIVPGTDTTNDVLLFIACNSGAGGDVSLAHVAKAGEIVTTCYADNGSLHPEKQESRLEVIVRLKVGQTIAFHATGGQADLVISYTWDGTIVDKDLYTASEWYDMQNPVLEPVPASFFEIVQAQKCILNFGRSDLNVDQMDALHRMYGTVFLSPPLGSDFYSVAELTAHVSGKTVFALPQTAILLEALATHSLADGTEFLFWTPDKDAYERDHFAVRSLLRITIHDGQLAMDSLQVTPTVEEDMHAQIYRYGGAEKVLT